jgi:hypothetical protein
LSFKESIVPKVISVTVTPAVPGLAASYAPLNTEVLGCKGLESLPIEFVSATEAAKARFKDSTPWCPVVEI